MSRIFSPELETLPEDELRSLRADLWRRQWDYLWERSDFYRVRFQDAGLARRRPVPLDELTRLPLTGKEDLRDSQLARPPFGSHAAASFESVVRVYSTSGTTGIPSYVGLTPRDLDLWRAAMARGIVARNVGPGDGVVTSAGAGPFVAGLAIEVYDRLRCRLIPLGPGHTDRVVAAFQRLKASVFVGTPSYAFHLLRYCDDCGIDPASLGLRVFLAAGEPGGGVPAVRARVEDAFACVMRESMGNGDICLGTWSECAEGRGMHLMARDSVYAELIDPETGESQPWVEGARGEVVYTHLERQCEPLVRFRSREHVVVVADGCPCGRTGPLIRCVGRTDDVLIVRGVNVYPSAVQDVVGQFRPQTTGEMEIEVDGPGPRYDPPLRVRTEVDDDRAADRTDLKAAIERALRERLVVQAAVELVPAGSLPRYEYKRRLVRRNHG